MARLPDFLGQGPEDRNVGVRGSGVSSRAERTPSLDGSDRSKGWAFFSTANAHSAAREVSGPLAPPERLRHACRWDALRSMVAGKCAPAARASPLGRSENLEGLVDATCRSGKCRGATTWVHGLPKHALSPVSVSRNRRSDLLPDHDRPGEGSTGPRLDVGVFPHSTTRRSSTKWLGT